ncbi:MFS transporter [uncultured Microbulbifer sp.]|uniref:MFS transporter n=1 Tax=uncultured Microbulbifer sp. TaxID=348147 RepID=UPI0026122AE3|nr:MFS transporter [uncultured Microbulbifer sp.]
MALCLATLLNALAVSSVNMALPELVAGLQTTYSRAQWVIVAFMIFLTAALAVAGRASDQVGRKKIFIHGVLIFTLANLLCVFSQNIWMLVLFRALQGIGAAMSTGVAMAIASDVLPKSRLGRAVGLLGSVSAVGTGSGPVLGGLLLEIASWQAIFLIQVPLGILIYFLGLKYLPDDRTGANSPKGARALNILSAFCIFSATLFYTLSIKPVNDYYGLLNIVSIVFAGVSLWLLWRLRFKGHRVSPIALAFTHYPLTINLGTNFLVAASVMSSLVVGPFYLTLALGLDFSLAGFVMSAGSFTVAICSTVTGRIVDRFKSRATVLFGLVCLILGALGMVYLRVSHGVGGYLLCTATMAVGYGTYLSANNAFTMSNAGEQVRGSISGLLNLFRNLGLLTGAALMSMVFASVADFPQVSTSDYGLVVQGLNRVYALALLFLLTAFVAQGLSILLSRFKNHTS